jgi:hypothetical protein
MAIVRGENKQTMKIIQLFRLSLKSNINIRLDLTSDSYQLLRGISAKINVLRELGDVDLFQRRTQNKYYFNTYIIIALSWSLILCGAYAYWIDHYVIENNCSGASCSIFIILIILSIFHFGVPLLILTSFIFKSNMVIQDIDIFHSVNMGEIRTTDVGSLLRYQTNQLDEMSTQWQWNISLEFMIPTIILFAIYIDTLKNNTIIYDEWFFFLYGIHYIACGIVFFYKASRITMHIIQIRKNLHGDIACGDAFFSNNGSSPEQNMAYNFYIYDCNVGYSIFGVIITQGMFFTIITFLIPVVSWLANNVTSL